MAIDLECNGLSARATHGDLGATLGPDAVAYRTVTRYLRETRSSPSSEANPSI
jgi:hypothetical protein